MPGLKKVLLLIVMPWLISVCEYSLNTWVISTELQRLLHLCRPIDEWVLKDIGIGYIWIDDFNWVLGAGFDEV